MRSAAYPLLCLLLGTLPTTLRSATDDPALPAPVAKARAPAAATAPAPAADNTKGAPAKSAVATPAPDDVIMMPKVEVTKSRVRELDVAIRKLDKQINREKKKLKAGELDKALNNPRITQAAAIFGGNSTAHLEIVAAQRVGLMETERDILDDMKRPKTLVELATLNQALELVRTTRRELDDPYR